MSRATRRALGYAVLTFAVWLVAEAIFTMPSPAFVAATSTFFAYREGWKR